LIAQQPLSSPRIHAESGVLGSALTGTPAPDRNAKPAFERVLLVRGRSRRDDFDSMRYLIHVAQKLPA